MGEDESSQPRVNVTELVLGIQRADGNRSTNTQPAGELLLISNLAPKWFASCLLIARPMPLPPSFVDWHGVKGLRPAGKPEPRSLTSQAMLSSAEVTVSCTELPGGDA